MALKTCIESFVLLFVLTHIKDMLIRTNVTLWSSVPAGTVPALFPDDEKESVLNQIRDEALKMGSGPSKDSVWQYFVNKCANNLHIVLGMSPVGDVLRTRCRNFPGNRERWWSSISLFKVS